jgi:hypothetical protein
MPITKASSSAVAPGAKGQLVVGNATNDSGIVTVGANGTVLTADSAEATGVKWGTVSAGGMTLISTTTLSGTTVTISSIPSTYKNLQIVMAGINAGSAFNITFKPNNVSPDTVGFFLLQGNTFTGVGYSDFGNYHAVTTTGKNAWVFNIYDYASSRYKNAFMTAVYPTSSGDQRILENGGYNTTDVISSLTITSSVSMTAGTCLIYGVS